MRVQRLHGSTLISLAALIKRQNHHGTNAMPS
jgi:hypothetical protein